ncbi:hypothetical protein M3Y99_01588300 [Aphelenchoides fujianensis]|nr:hypothetical protein M3Y99_01588300 [Aphelenchoides fujianensis]
MLVFNFLLAFFFLLSFGPRAKACTCTDSPRYTALQLADFVTKCRVVGSKMSPGGTALVYNVRHLRVFKPNDTQLAEEMFTSPWPSSCGVTQLEKDHEYLLVGYESSGKLRLNTCLSVPASASDTSSPPGALDWKSVDAELAAQLEAGVFT